MKTAWKYSACVLPLESNEAICYPKPKIKEEEKTALNINTYFWKFESVFDIEKDNVIEKLY